MQEEGLEPDSLPVIRFEFLGTRIRPLPWLEINKKLQTFLQPDGSEPRAHPSPQTTLTPPHLDPFLPY